MEISLLIKNIIQEYTILFVDKDNLPMILIHSQHNNDSYGFSKSYEIKSTNKDFFSASNLIFTSLESALETVYKDFRNNQKKYIALKDLNQNNTQIINSFIWLNTRDNEIEQASLLLLSSLIDLGYLPRKKCLNRIEEIEIKLKNQPTTKKIEFPNSFYEYNMSSYTSNNFGCLSFALCSRYDKKEYLKAENISAILDQIARCEEHVKMQLID